MKKEVISFKNKRKAILVEVPTVLLFKIIERDAIRKYYRIIERVYENNEAKENNKKNIRW